MPFRRGVIITDCMYFLLLVLLIDSNIQRYEEEENHRRRNLKRKYKDKNMQTISVKFVDDSLPLDSLKLKLAIQSSSMSLLGEEKRGKLPRTKEPLLTIFKPIVDESPTADLAPLHPPPPSHHSHRPLSTS